jgi:hypothetical protein
MVEEPYLTYPEDEQHYPLTRSLLLSTVSIGSAQDVETAINIPTGWLKVS